MLGVLVVSRTCIYADTRVFNFPEIRMESRARGSREARWAVARRIMIIVFRSELASFLLALRLLTPCPVIRFSTKIDATTLSLAIYYERTPTPILSLLTPEANDG